jgi:hypothetical protein
MQTENQNPEAAAQPTEAAAPQNTETVVVAKTRTGGLSKTQKVVAGLLVAGLVVGAVVACFAVFGKKEEQPA